MVGDRRRSRKSDVGKTGVGLGHRALVNGTCDGKGQGPEENEHFFKPMHRDVNPLKEKKRGGKKPGFRRSTS